MLRVVSHDFLSLNRSKTGRWLLGRFGLSRSQELSVSSLLLVTLYLSQAMRLIESTARVCF